MNFHSPKKLLQNSKTPSSKVKPFFIRDKDDRTYTGFPLISETETDGFVFGAITDYLENDSKEGCTYGDGFVQGPNGSRAGIVWNVNKDIKIQTLL